MFLYPCCLIQKEKDKVCYRPGKLNEKKSDREPEREIKTKESNFVEITT